ncbi:MAG: DUF4097 family beta strand repeat-containing protein [Candidatus Aminicenantes bacterium]|nr:DUF4097 family beta strand repeat-containing protein [Candidatus Aminicenantes bacterium]
MSMRNSNKNNSLAIAAVLVLGLVLSGCVIVAADGGFSLPGGKEFREDYHKTFPLGPDGRFSVKNVNGDIHISTWDKAEADVTAVKISKSNEENLKLVKIEEQSGSGFVAIDTIWPKSPFRNLRISVDYEIKVPAGVRLELVRSTNGDVELIGKFGEVAASSTNGNVRLEGAAGPAVLDTTNGDIVARDIRGSVKADTTNGGITLTVDGLKDNVTADTTNGSIRVKLLGTVNARLEARTTNGHIDVAVPVTIKDLSKSRSRLSGTIGDGGPLMKLDTTNGSITIEK